MPLDSYLPVISGGTGLGLSVSYGLIQEHKGIIGLHSRRGVGSRFPVFLPIDQEVQLNLQPAILCSFLLIINSAYARSAMLFGIRFLDYGRPGGGTGSGFFKEKLKLSAFWGMIIPVGLSGLVGWRKR